jgi:hypothetical protein
MGWVGEPLLRKEDRRFITGSASHVDDIAARLPGVGSAGPFDRTGRRNVQG